MNTKKIGLLSLLVFAGFSAISSASCQEIKFPNGNHFCFDIEKTSSDHFLAKTSSLNLDTNNDLSCTLILPNNKSIVLPKCEGSFEYAGKGKQISIKANIQNYWYELITNYDFNHGTFFIDFSKEDRQDYDDNYEPKITYVSTNHPSRDQRIDVTIDVKSRNNSSFEGDVHFSIEEYRNGRWGSASNYKYELDKNRHYFSKYDREERINNLIKFKEEGKFRLVAQIHNNYKNSYSYENFYVENYSESNSNYYEADRLEIYSISPSTARVNEYIDLKIRALDRYGNLAKNYDSKIRFEVEEYRNGYWRNANNSDYDLDSSSYRFSSYDKGEKTFSDIIRFRTTGEFRIRVFDEYRNRINDSVEVKIRERSYEYPSWSHNSSFTNEQLRKIRAVSNLWEEVIKSLENDYPRLRRNSSWKDMSNRFYRDMKDILRSSSSASLRDRSDFYSAFQERFSYTIKTR